jgi:hypothetical protein
LIIPGKIYNRKSGEENVVFSRKQNVNKLRLIDILVFNTTFSNISAISWRPVLVVEETGVHEENHRPLASNW